jgi:hypothetical protein
MSPIQPCQRTTIALAAEGRPDWDARAAENAIIRGYQASWTPGRVLFEVVRLMGIEDSEPRDLDAALARPAGFIGLGEANSARIRRVKAAKARHRG